MDSRIAEHVPDILRLARRRRLLRVSVFGSAARGEAGAHSDVDLLVDPDERASLFHLLGFELDVEELLGQHVDVVSRRGLSPHLADRILAEEVPL